MSDTKKEIKIVCLDFDGTIVDSNKIKDQAFEKIFSEWPHHRDFMMKWHYENNFIDRYGKFNFFVEQILKEKGNTDLKNKLINTFQILTEELIISCPFIKGANHFLNEISSTKPLYLLSATPSDNLLKILKKRKIFSLFDNIYGSPINKKKVIEYLIKKHNISSNNVLYIGDTQEDLDTARNIKINFILRKSDRKVKKSCYPEFENFNMIKEYFYGNYE